MSASRSAESPVSSRVFSGRVDRDQRVRVVEAVRLDRSRPREELLRGLLRPGNVDSVTGQVCPLNRVGAAAPDCAADLLEQRTRERTAVHEHLPPALHVDARLDEERSVLLDPRVVQSAPP